MNGVNTVCTSCFVSTVVFVKFLSSPDTNSCLDEEQVSAPVDDCMSLKEGKGSRAGAGAEIFSFGRSSSFEDEKVSNGVVSGTTVTDLILRPSCSSLV